MNVLKKFAPILLAAFLIALIGAALLPSIQVYALDEIGEESSELPEEDNLELSISFTPEGEDFVIDEEEENSELFNQYIEKLMNEEGSGAGPLRAPAHADSSLSGNDALFYPYLKSFVKQVAAGSVTYTKLYLSPEDLGFKTEYTASDFGVSAFYENGAWNSTFKNKYEEKLGCDIGKLVAVLIAELPSEFYWIKGYGFSTPEYTASWNSTDGAYTTLKVTGQFEFRFSVRRGYRLSESSDYEINPADVNRAKTAAQNARSIVQQYASYSDVDKLRAYRDKICSLVEYDYAALAITDYDARNADTYQMVYVFDNDPNTNVVCAGYAKAFQYLCNLSTFQNDISVIYVTGDMYPEGGEGGPHAWNVVRLSDQINYLVDVTNVDAGSYGTNTLFLVTPAYGSVNGGYTIDTGSKTILYVYDEDTLSIFTSETLAIGSYVSRPTINSFVGHWNVFAGQTAKYTVSASGTWLTYQWQISKDNGSTWQNATYTGSKTKEMTVKTTASMDGWLLRCVVTDANGLSTATSGGKITISKITKQPTTQYAAPGMTVTFSVTAQGSNLSYQWMYYSTATGTWENCTFTGSTTSSMSFTMQKSYENRSFRCKVITPNASLYSDSAQVKPWSQGKPTLSSLENAATGVKVSWKKMNGTAKYAVYRKGPGETSFTKLGATAALSYTDKTAVSGKEYRYALRAVASDGSQTAFSTGKSILFLKAPVISSVANASNGVTVSWGKVGGAAKYAIYRKSSSETTFKKIVTTTALSYTNKNVAIGKQYRYTVRAIASDGETISAYSTGKTILYLKAPTISLAENVSTGIKLNWTKATGAAKYAVYRKDPGATSFKKLAATSSLTYTDKTAISGKEYRYSVRTVSSDGTLSAFSTGKTIKCLKAPVISSAANAASGIKISWGKVAGAAKYAVYRKGPGDSAFKKITTTAALTFTNKTPVSGSNYRYAIRAIAADGETMSAYSTGVTVKYVKAPKITSGINLTSEIKITWEKVTAGVKYYVFRKGPSDTSFKKVATTTAQIYTDGSVAAGKTYRYSIRAERSDGALSAFSTGKSVTFLKAPVISSVENTATGIKVTFSKVAGAAKYRVLRMATGESSWKTVAHVTGTTYTDTSLVSGQRYTYSIRAIAADGTSLSVLSDAKSVNYMKAPVISSAANLSTGVKITWGKVTEAAKYFVYRKGPGETSFKKIAATTELTYTDTKVSAGKEYRYSIRSVKSNGVTMSAFSTGRSIVFLKAPSITAGTSTSSGLKITFSKSAGAAKYRILRKAPGETNWTAVAHVTTTSYTDTAVASGKKYTYSIRAVAADGSTMSPLSAAKSYTYKKP